MLPRRPPRVKEERNYTLECHASLFLELLCFQPKLYHVPPTSNLGDRKMHRFCFRVPNIFIILISRPSPTMSSSTSTVNPDEGKTRKKSTDPALASKPIWSFCAMVLDRLVPRCSFADCFFHPAVAR
ncbi:unnamed protein product [Amoebophrya sp. A120]|nr:unnamed protein product [Amoebophrya sp. A120]|eukprot:GSA120T00000023001.1